MVVFNCERCCERIQCVRKYNVRFNPHAQGKTTFISPTFQAYMRQQRQVFLTSEGGGRQQSFTQAAPNELKLGEGEKLVRAGHRLGGGVGMGEKEVGGGQTTRRAFAP